jgi:hypothetical protein
MCVLYFLNLFFTLGRKILKTSHVLTCQPEEIVLAFYEITKDCIILHKKSKCAYENMRILFMISICLCLIVTYVCV